MYTLITALLTNDVIPQAALDIWVMILRFMGDMSEPKETPASPEGKGESGGSGLKKLYGTIKEKFGKAKEDGEGGGGSAEQVRGGSVRGGGVKVCSNHTPCSHRD